MAGLASAGQAEGGLGIAISAATEDTGGFCMRDVSVGQETRAGADIYWRVWRLNKVRCTFGRNVLAIRRNDR